MQYFLKIRSYFINKIINRIRYIRYPANYLKKTEKNLRLVKILSEKFNFREKNLRSFFPNLSNFSQAELVSLKENGFLVLKKERLKKIDDFDKIFLKLQKKFEDSLLNGDFTQGQLFKVLKLMDMDKEIKEIEKFANIFLPLASHYLNLLPVKSSASFWYSESKSNKFEFSGSQLPHFDWEDLNQIKIFLAFSDIADENGPINVLPKKNSDEIKKILKEKKIELSDKLDLSLFPNYKFIKMNLNEGDVLVVDTSSCYHFGGRCLQNSRKQLLIQFNDPFSMNYPLVRFMSDKDLVNDYHVISYSRIKLSKEKKIF